MPDIQLIPDLERTLQTLVDAMNHNNIESLNLMKAKHLVEEIDKLRIQYNYQLSELRQYYGPKFLQNLNELKQLTKNVNSPNKAAE